MAYKHGVFTAETPTSLTPPVEVESGLIFCVGTSAVHLATNPAPVNTPVLCYEFSEYVEQFGYTKNLDDFTNDEMSICQYQLFNVAPIVFVNVLDPDKHYKNIEIELGGVSENPATIQSAIILDSLKVTSTGETKEVTLLENTDFTATENIESDPADNYYTIDIMIDAALPSDDLILTYQLNGQTVTENKNAADLPFDLPKGATNLTLKAVVTPINVLVKDEDYTAAYNSDGEVIFTVLDSSKIYQDAVQLKYHELDPSQVTESDIIGGYDATTGKNTGLELIEEVYPRFRLTPGIIVAPKFSTDVTVAAVMKAKATNINSVFNAVAICDIPTDEVKTYTAAAEYKNLKNLIDTSLIVCYPKVSIGGVQYHLSTQLASLMNKVDAAHDSIPYKSPSNERLQCDSSVLADGTELFLTLDQAQYLNGQGIVTALNFSQGWTAYGNRTSIYPSSTDPKDSFISIRRTFYFIRNTLTLTYFSKVDQPINKRLIKSIVDSVNIYLNGLTARGVLNGGRLEFLSTENSTLDLMDGKITFHLYLNVPSPARDLEFVLEYDPTYLSTLFE